MKKVVKSVIQSSCSMLLLCGVAFVASVLGACSSGAGSGESDEIKVIEMAKALASNPQEIALSEVATSVEYIPLDMGGEFLPGYHFLEMAVDENSIYFFPKPNFPNSPIFCFSADGKLLSHFKHVGRAENEWVIPVGVVLDKANDQLIVNEETVVKFYTPQGEFVKSINLDLPDYGFFTVVMYVGGKVQFMKSTKEGYSTYALDVDDNGNVVSDNVLIDYSTFPQEYWTDPSVRSSVEVISKSSENYLLLHKFTDSIYSYRGTDSAEVAYVLDMGNLKDGYKRKVSMGGYCYEAPNFLILQTVHSMKYFDNLQTSERMNYIFFDKAAGRTIKFAKNDENDPYFKNDIDGGMPFFPYHISGNKMYQLVDAYKFIEQADATGSVKMREIASKLNEDSNPVLVVATLK